MSYETRQTYEFTCIECKKEHRQSVKKEIAEKGLCRKCRYPKIAKGKTSLFDTEQIPEQNHHAQGVRL